jgi:hypothetical protein
MAQDHVPIQASILTPEETDAKVWVAVVEGYHVRATDREHAERIIMVCKACASKGRSHAQHGIVYALGLRAWGSTVTSEI